MKKLILLGLVVFILLFSGCAKEEKKEGAKEEKKEVQKTPQEQFEELVAKKKAGTFKVNYDMEMSMMGQKMSGKYMLAMKGEKKMKTETTMTMLGQEFTSSIFVIDDNVYTCMSQAGETVCMKSTKAEMEEQQTIPDIEKDPSKYTITAAPPRTIAGTLASCFKTTITLEGQSVEVEYCYSSEGIPLYSSMKVEGMAVESTISATSYTTTVSDDEFNLPAEPVDISEMPGFSSSESS